MNYLVKTERVTADMFPLAEESKAAYLRVLGKSEEPAQEGDQALHDAYAQASKMRHYVAQMERISKAGECWRAVIVDAATKEAQHVSPMFWADEFHAQRCGDRTVKRFQKTGKWTKE
mgnify:CR=1 FL=1